MGVPEENNIATKELLLKELENFENAIWRNEETGEKRFNFFITLVTAVGGGVVALWTADEATVSLPAPDWVRGIAWQAGVGLLIFGLLSFLRMKHRDRVTQRYKDTLKDIRKIYKQAFSHSDLEMYQGPRNLYADSDTASKRLKQMRRVMQGGYTVSIALVNGVLLTVTLIAADIAGNCNLAVAATSGAVFTMVLGYIGTLPIDAR